MLKVNAIKKSYGDKIILRDASIEVPAGFFTTIEGKNGTGKSTLFGILCGITSHDGGTIMLDNVSIDNLNERERAQRIAILRQDPSCSSVMALSVLENFALALLKTRCASLRKATRKCIKEQAHHHLQKLGLDGIFDLEKPLALFSGGQRQMLAFAFATINKPQLLLLDEPTAALDEHAADLMMVLIKRCLSDWQIPAVMISHDHELNQKYADEIFVLHDGILRKK